MAEQQTSTAAVDWFSQAIDAARQVLIAKYSEPQQVILSSVPGYNQTGAVPYQPGLYPTGVTDVSGTLAAATQGNQLMNMVLIGGAAYLVMKAL